MLNDDAMKSISFEIFCRIKENIKLKFILLLNSGKIVNYLRFDWFVYLQYITFDSFLSHRRYCHNVMNTRNENQSVRCIYSYPKHGQTSTRNRELELVNLNLLVGNRQWHQTYRSEVCHFTVLNTASLNFLLGLSDFQFQA